jgi:tetratricopeptide (TPR) repeat protein
LLARIALARRDVETARTQAALASEAEPGRPLSAFVEGRLAYDAGEYPRAEQHFRQAVDAAREGIGRPIPELHYYLADTLSRMDRPDDAEPHFVAELRRFPSTLRAWIGLATLYQNTARPDDAARVLDALVHVSPTPDAYAAAVRTSTGFGNFRQAAAIKAEAQRADRPN